jgi:hypothetical protein
MYATLFDDPDGSTQLDRYLSVTAEQIRDVPPSCSAPTIASS